MCMEKKKKIYKFSVESKGGQNNKMLQTLENQNTELNVNSNKNHPASIIMGKGYI